MPSKQEDKLKTGYIKVQLDYAPRTNGKKFAEWCKKYDFDPLGSGRRAWCSSLGTYFRGAAGVAFNDGEMFLFYEEDIVDPEEACNQRVREARIDELERAERQKIYKGISANPKYAISADYIGDRLATLKKED